MADKGVPDKSNGQGGSSNNPANNPANNPSNSPRQNPEQKAKDFESKKGDTPNRGFDLRPSRDIKKDSKGGGIGKKAAVSGALANAAANNTGAAGKAARGAQKAVEVGKKVANVAAKTGKAATQLVGILTNPATWLVLAVIVAVIAVVMGSIAALQTIGKNDTSDGCYGIGVGSGSSTIRFEEGDTAEIRANKMMTWLLEQPAWEVNDGGALSKEQAAAIVGNFMAESAMEPNTIEMSAPNWEAYMGADNDRMDAWTQENTPRKVNIGIGIAQWTWNPGRAGGLIKKARETGTQWYEIEPQLEFMKEEMNGAYAPGLKKVGFADSGKSLSELSSGFHDIYEVSADTAAMKARRGEEAKKILSEYTGGATGGKSRIVSGGSCGRSASSADMSTPTALAYSIAWPADEYDRALTDGGNGKKEAKPEYLDAKEAAMEIQPEAGVHVDLYASCDRVVATILINTIDKDVPWGPTGAQRAYFQGAEDKWEQVPLEDRQEGDILMQPQHIAYYVGEGDSGANTIVQGSIPAQVANVQDGTYIINDPAVEVFRFIGTPDSTGSSLVD